MRTPQTSTEHVCEMPKPSDKHRHALYICDCGCGWRTVPNRRFEGIVWKWEQVL